MPVRRYYVTRRYSRRNTTPDAHCNQFGVGMRDPLIYTRVRVAHAVAPAAIPLRTIATPLHLCTLVTGHRSARLYKRTRARSLVVDPVAFPDPAVDLRSFDLYARHLT